MNSSSDSKYDSSPQSETTPSDCSSRGSISNRLITEEPSNMSLELLEIYSENVLAKLLRVAKEALEKNVS
jgi:hypothetical protein